MDARTESRLFTVAVLSCGSLGREVANHLAQVPGMKPVLFTTPYRGRHRSVLGRIRHTWRMDGPGGLARAVGRRLPTVPSRPSRDGADRDAGPPLEAGIPHHHFQDFHDLACRAEIRRARPDLGVLAGTYILEESVFGIPGLGSVNLHSGKAPEYRGAAPAFWELYNGETQVGITIHEVVRDLDAGRILRQELFLLDPAPSGDPLEYLERYRREVLRPNGVRLLVETVRAVRDGTVTPVPQDPSRAQTFRSPDYRAKRELRRRVRRRRREGVWRGGHTPGPKTVGAERHP